MRVGLISTLATPVRADGAGSVESLVHALADGLVRRGHEVTVFASGNSTPPCELVAALPGTYGAPGVPGDWERCEWINVCRAIEESHRFDVLHSHSYLNAVPATGLSACRMLHSLHVSPGIDDALLLRHAPAARVIALSHSQWSEFPQVEPFDVIPHGIDPAAHTFRADSAGHLAFLGRLIAGKGPLDAIAAARELAMPLHLAGPRSDHFTRGVEPLVDGKHIRWLGPIGVDARDELLAGAAALLYPIRDPEPFGLVMVEAMMSGTPVAAFSLGAVPEIVEDGLTGALVEPGGDLAGAVRRCLELDRAAVRARAEERFSAGRMVDAYARAYERLAVGVPA